MEKSVLIKGDNCDIPGVLSYTETTYKMPAVILCHGTGAQKNEVGNLFAILAEKLLQRGIASVRIDYVGCGDSKADQRQLTFLGEVEDTKRTYQYICDLEYIDQENIGILGFSQGARVMAELLKEIQEFTCVASWSGACQNGRGAFESWFQEYYQEAKEQGYAKIPMGWRDDLLLSKQWFDEIENTTPMEGFRKYAGPVLAIAGSADEIVPCSHAKEIMAESTNEQSKMLILPGADHIFNVLSEDKTIAEQVLNTTVDWFAKIMMKGESTNYDNK